MNRFSNHSQRDIDFLKCRIDISHIDSRTQKLFGYISQHLPKTVLEIGCGEGIALRYMNPITYVGVDTSRVRLRYASNSFKGNSFVQGDGTCLPFSSDQFDLVFCNGTLHHISKHKIFRVLEEMKRTCREGGWVAIMEPNAYNPSSFLLGLLRKPERGILNCKPKRFLGYFRILGMSYNIKLKYDGTFSLLNLLTYVILRKNNFIRTTWFNKVWEKTDLIVNRIVPQSFWTNMIIMAKKQ